jgi:hypothetical protein
MSQKIMFSVDMGTCLSLNIRAERRADGPLTKNLLKAASPPPQLEYHNIMRLVIAKPKISGSATHLLRS